MRSSLSNIFIILKLFYSFVSLVLLRSVLRISEAFSLLVNSFFLFLLLISASVSELLEALDRVLCYFLLFFITAKSELMVSSSLKQIVQTPSDFSTHLAWNPCPHWNNHRSCYTMPPISAILQPWHLFSLPMQPLRIAFMINV